MANADYQRLTRARLRWAFGVLFTTRSSLWLGQDHLLVIDSNGYTETYRRFFFRDIQCFMVALSQRQITWNIVLGVLTVIGVVGWALYFRSHAPGLVSASLATATVLLFGVPLLMNNLLGATCTCHLRTAVQTGCRPSIKRVRQAHRIMDQLRPLILQAQSAQTSGTGSLPTQQPTGTAGEPPGAEGGSPEPGNIPPRIVA